MFGQNRKLLVLLLINRVSARLVFSRFFDIRRNLGNAKEKPTRKLVYRVK